MRSVQVTENAVSIWLSSEGVPERRQMLDMVKKALADEGFTPWPETEAECFASGEDALVIARPAPPHPKAFWFPTLEALLAGISVCSAPGGSLYRADDGFLLTVAPENETLAMSEFGTPRQVNFGWEAHAAEQGLCLLSGAAVTDLNAFFAT